MTPERLRLWAVVLTRDIGSPVVGLLALVYLIVTRQLAIWQVPLIISLVGVPFVGRGEVEPEPDGRKELPPESGP